jgi:hypothetical protein
MIYSKLNPIIKDSITDFYEKSVISYINLTKPYHTKLKDIIVNFKFVENINAIIDETGQPPVDTIVPGTIGPVNLFDTINALTNDNIISTIGFILDYNKTEYVDDYGQPLKLLSKYKKESYGYEIVPFGHSPLGANLDHTAIGDVYDMLHPTYEYNQNNNDTTIKTSIKERLIIDTSRTLVLGFDYRPYDTDKYDTIDTTGVTIPPPKVFVHSDTCGDESFVWGGLDTDIFHKFFTDWDTDTLELPRTLPPFDTDIFEKMFKN